jgi:hypothetical protein
VRSFTIRAININRLCWSPIHRVSRDRRRHQLLRRMRMQLDLMLLR